MVNINKQARAILTSLLETFDAIDQLGSVENATAEARLELQRIKDAQAESEKQYQRHRDNLKESLRKQLEDAQGEVAKAIRQASAITSEARQNADEILAAAGRDKVRLTNEATALAVTFTAAQEELQRVKDAIVSLDREREAGAAKLAAIREALAKFQV